MLLGIAEHDPEAQVRLGAMLDELQRLGWRSANLDIVYRWSGDDAERVRAYAAELVALAPDLIVALSPPVLAAVLARTRTIPIVFVQVSDPVGGGLVESLSHPGGNATGFTGFQETVSGKWLELLKEAVPSVRRVAVIRNAAKASSSEYLMGTLRSVAPAVGVELIVAPFSAGGDIEAAYATVGQRGRRRARRDARPDHAREPSPHRRSRVASRSPGCLSLPLLRSRAHFVRAGAGRHLAARSRLRRPYSQRCEAVGAPRAAPDQVRAGHKC